MRKRSLKYSPCHRVKSHIFEVKIAKNSRVDIFCDRRSWDFFPVSLFFSEKQREILCHWMLNREGEADILLQERMLENRCSPDDHIFNKPRNRRPSSSLLMPLSTTYSCCWRRSEVNFNAHLCWGQVFVSIKYRFKPKCFALFWVMYYLVDLLSIVPPPEPCTFQACWLIYMG